MMFYSLKNRLIVFFVVLLVLSFGTMSFLIFNESRSIIRSYIESSALEKMDEYGSFINMATSQIYDVSSLVFNSDITKEWDRALSDPTLSAGEKMLANITLSKFLTQTTNNYSSVSSVSIYRNEGLGVSDGNQVLENYPIIHEKWYHDFVNHSNHWVSAHMDQLEVNRSKPYQVVSLLLPIGTFEPSLSKNVLKVNVSSEFFLEPLSRIHLGESGTIFLLDQDGSPILSQTEYSSHSDASTYVQNIRDGYSDQGVVYIKNDQGSNEILVYKKLNINNWLLVGFVSEEDLYDKLNKLRTSIMIFSTLLLIAAILVASWLSYGITKPLSSLALAMRSVQKGDFSSAESRIPPERIVRNEVGYVTATFRNMVEQLKYHIKIEFELKLLRQQAEYKALLMQINPHFLFNTLELLSSLVLQSRTQDSVKVIEALGKMLRFSLRINDDLIPLEEELKYLRHYISILQIRFKERLMISVEEEGSLDQREIIKFILQPLVENAVKYSFIQQDVAEVKILTYVTAEGVQLIVADNGPGMLPELVQQLYTDFENVQLNQILSSGSKHIGLRNVLARCELYYGAQFKFKIESKVDWGTRIELYLPVKGEQTHVSSDDRR